MYIPVLARAFGHMLIVADEDVASAISSAPHNLTCVTLDGIVSRPGSVSGGWSGIASAAEVLIFRWGLREQADQLSLSSPLHSYIGQNIAVH